MNDVATSGDFSVESILSRVSDEFIERLSKGERIDIEDYVRCYPQLATILRQVLPALASLRLPHAVCSLPSSESLVAPVPLTGCLGDFRLIREVGRGGMGIVYEAEQISLGRRVALKVLPLAPALDAKQLRRFKNEAQAAAHLHHSHIVPVYAVGCDRGVHYYAMQFIEGQTLAAMVAELEEQTQFVARVRRYSSEEPELTTHQKSAVPCLSAARGNRQTFELVGRSANPSHAAGENVETQAVPQGTLASKRSSQEPAFFHTVAQLGVQAAEALEYAHQMGVVHRDIKPANLMVDAHGHLWITDFGLARCGGEGVLTVSGDVVGTLRYMSPEQALGKRLLLDHRSDVYSLGVTLYELLTLEPAYAGRDREELLQKITGEEPRRPRRLNPAVPLELETIVLKAMAKEPEGRYPTAQELADDLKRFLEHKPIWARQPSAFERLRKWARRHRPIVLAGVVLLVLALMGTSVSSFLIWQEQARTKAALALAEKQRLAAETQRQRAMKNMRISRSVIIRFLARLEEKCWAYLPKLHSLRLALAEELVDSFQVFANTESSDPDTQYDAGLAYMLVGNVYRVQGVESKAEPAFQKALALLEALVSQFPTDCLYRGELALSHSTLGVFLEDTEHPAEATEHFRKAVEHYQQAIERQPNCRLLNNYAWFLATCPQTPFRDPVQAVALAERAVAAGPEWGDVWNTLGAARYRAGDWPGATAALKRSMELRGNGDGFDWYFLAMAYWQQNEKEKAHSWYRRAERELAKTNIYIDPIRRIQVEAAALLGIKEQPARERKKSNYSRSGNGSTTYLRNKIKRLRTIA
jgi:serine/threonine protein kinase